MVKVMSQLGEVRRGIDALVAELESRDLLKPEHSLLVSIGRRLADELDMNVNGTVARELSQIEKQLRALIPFDEDGIEMPPPLG